MADSSTTQGPQAGRPLSRGGDFEHPLVFWLGVLACTAGVLLHLPMYVQARHMGYMMVGMRPDAPMLTGMALIVAGLLAVFYGIVPRRSGEIARTASHLKVTSLDDAPIRRQHVVLLLLMSLAVTIDVMKPASLGFIAPGAAKEYGLKSPANPAGHIPVSWLPLTGIVGTVIGSWLWGALGDRIGRRASIVLSGMLFVTTSICGTMPGFKWNLLMCLLMGIGAGGMLPVAFTLIAEIMPARHRGWLLVLVGGNAAVAYAATSWLSGELMPTYSWRIMWLIGLPTGLLLILLNRWIPESPRHLLAVGRAEEAETVLARYGAVLRHTGEEPAAPVAEGPRGGYLGLFRPPFGGISAAITVLGLGIGLVTYGFQLWIPTNLQHLGYSSVNSDYVVRNAALIGLPLTVVGAWLYARFGSRRTMVAMCVVTAVVLGVIAAAGDSLAHHELLLSLLLVVPLSGISSVVAVVSGYASEVYPTAVRSRGSGLAAGMTKLGGVLILAVIVSAGTVPSITETALIGAAPLLVAAVALLRTGPETKRRQLEEISREVAEAAG